MPRNTTQSAVKPQYVVRLSVTFRYLTHSLTATRNRLWVVAPSMLTGRQRIDQKEGAPECNAPLGTGRSIAVQTGSS